VNQLEEPVAIVSGTSDSGLVWPIIVPSRRVDRLKTEAEPALLAAVRKRAGSLG